MSVSSTIRYTFDVAKFGGKEYISHPIPVFRKDVPVSFALKLEPNAADCPDHLGVYLRYMDGPLQDVVCGYELFVVTDTGSVSVGKSNRTFSRGGGYGCRYLPRSLEALASGGYLKSNNTLLEIKANITIPDDAFDNPDGSCKVLTKPEKSLPELIASYLFDQLTTAASTNHPSCDRFQLRATDGNSFWAHKGILALSSEVFKERFDSKKPPKGKRRFWEGLMDMDIGRDALWHLLHFVYLGETAKGFNRVAWEIVEVAERFGFKDLKRICERSLLDRLDTIPINDVLSQRLTDSERFGLAQLRTAIVKKLTEGLSGAEKLRVLNQEGFLLNLIEFAHQHHHAALKRVCDAKLAGMLQFNVDTDQFLAMVSVARKHDLHKMELGKWCTKWMGRNHQMFKDQGHLTRLINDQEGHGVIEFLIEAFSIVSMQQESPRWGRSLY